MNATGIDYEIRWGQGSNATVRIFGIALTAVQQIFSRAREYCDKTTGATYISVETSSKWERESVDKLVDKFQRYEQRQTAPAVAVKRIELLRNAEKLGYKCGAAWRCTDNNVDKFSLDPSWEGELICYVYP